MEINLREYFSEVENHDTIQETLGSIYLGPRHLITDPRKLPSASEIINESTNKTGIEIPDSKMKQFDSAWIDGMKQLFHEKYLEFQNQQEKDKNTTSNTITELDNFLETGLSNGRPLLLQIMVCPPDKWFKLHAHPNIESMLTLKGSLHELRAIGPPIEAPTFYFLHPENNNKSKLGDSKEETNENSKVREVKGPSIPFSTFFEKKSTVKGQMIVNEIGSVHQSYTTSMKENVDEDGDDGNGISMLVLWSGCHANTPSSNVFCRDARLKL